jgi:signal transduction histidine kinase
MEIDQIKSNLLRAISHEFRTPLTVIYGWIDLLLGEPPPSQTPLQVEGLKAIKDSSLRLGRMISNLLEYVAISKEETRPKRDRVELPPLVEEALQQLEEEAQEKNLSVVKTFSSDLPPLLADLEKMKILIFNLVENAIKFNEPGGSVVVEGEMVPGQDRLRLRITNTRGEIPRDRLSELMKPFAQADMSITRSASGLGLGLTVAKGIVDAHQGEFHIGSDPGKGSTVEIEFPLQGTQ